VREAVEGVLASQDNSFERGASQTHLAPILGTRVLPAVQKDAISQGDFIRVGFARYETPTRDGL